MAGAFLQTNAADALKRMLMKASDMDGKEDVLAFLSGGTNYAPQSGQIVGILKQMADTMAANLAAATADEEKAIAAYKELMDAKTKESNALQASIEAKIKKIGDLAVEIVQLKNDLGEAGQALEEDKKFLADLEKGCATKTAEWEERSKTRAEELLALADTIKVLNDDDALELFKKTLPAPSLLQIQFSSKAVKQQALRLLKAGGNRKDPRFQLVMLALTGKSNGTFDKVLKMIDDMVAL